MIKTKPTSPRSSAKRQAILDAAQSCFLELGYANASMDGVAARAGVSKATIYAHFDSKSDLFRAIISRHRDTRVNEAQLDALEGNDIRAILTQLGHFLINLFLAPDIMGIYRMVVAEADHHPDLAAIYYETGPINGKRCIAEILTRLHQRGLLHLDDPLRATDQFVSLLRGEIFNRVLLGLPPHERWTAEGTVRDAVETMLLAWGANVTRGPNASMGETTSPDARSTAARTASGCCLSSSVMAQ